MLKKLSAHQESLLLQWRYEWLAHGLSTAPADRPAAEAGVDLAYAAAGMDPPRIKIWLDSPYQGAIGAALLADSKFGPSVGAQVRAQVRDQVGAQVRAQVGAEVWAEVRAQVRAQVGDQVWAEVWAQVGAQVRAQVRAQVGAQVGKAVYGQHDAGWLAFYDFFGRVGGLPCVEKLAGLMQISRSCGWWWPFRGAVILTDRPAKLSRDAEGRLHSTDGMAIEYRDGWGIHAVHGARVPAFIIDRPEEITPKLIDAERNAEIRRVMIERYKIGAEISGAAAYLLDGGAKEIDRAIDYTKDPIVLYRREVQDDEPIVILGMKNSTPEPDGRIKDYFLRVPPTMTKAREAMAWSYGLSANQYRPEIET